MIFCFVTSFFCVYFVWKLGIAAATVGTILLVARVWDAINDPMLSVVVEKSRFKGGKFKPWINFVAILVPASTVLLFSFSSFLADSSMPVKIAYASGTYILWGMIYTISDAPAFALATVMSPNSDERNTLISFAHSFGFIGLIIGMAASMPLVNATSWFIASLLIAVPGMLFMLQVRRAKERIKSSQTSPSMKDIIKAIVSNKYLIIIVLCLIFRTGFDFGLTIMPMVAADIFGNANLVSIIMMANMLPMLIALPFTPRLVKKFGKITLFKFTTIATIVLSVIRYFAGYENFGLFMGLTGIRGFLTGISNIIPSLIFADCIEFYYYKTKNRFEAATFSAQTFSSKAIGALSGAGGMWILAAFGYMAGEGVTQTSEVIRGMWLTFNIGPAIGALIALIVFWVAYDLSEKKLVEMKINAGL
jgi:sugar (glycoside-pentoside-hexuronide) transporter